MGSGFKTDVLQGIIFHNHQKNYYMTSPVSIPLLMSLEFARYLRLAFCHCIDLNIVVTYIICTGALRNQSNIYDEAFCGNSKQLLAIFAKSLHHSCIDGL